MRNVALALFVVLLIPIVALSQGLYFTVLDSINYNPRSLTVADFNGDGLDELFVGTDTGLVVIDPRTHAPLWDGQTLRERIDATMFSDINGDGAKDMVIGSYLGRAWLRVVWGPDYQNIYTWGGYTVPVLKLFKGILPDTQNIMLAGQGYGLCINPDTWDYTATVGDISTGSRKCEVITTISSENSGYPTFTRYLNIISSSFTQVGRYSIGTYLAPGPNYTIAKIQGGTFLAATNSYVTLLYCIYDLPGNAIMTIRCLDNQGVLIRSVSDSSYNTNRQIIGTTAMDLNGDRIDELCLYFSINGYAHIKVYNGINFGVMTQIDSIARTMSNPMPGLFYSNFDRAITYQANNKIYLAVITNQLVPVGDDLILPLHACLETYPNPFNGSLTISLALEQTSKLNIKALNLLGQEVENIFIGTGHQGLNSFQWNSRSLSSGVYFIIATGDNFKVSKKVSFLK